ncbi:MULTISPECIES: hypothetical protein [unclassified Algibacter]|uniref:hypothetical protein n=1 Tax=unclassified Algibacter TaxID=2615009 RepID=UPI00131C9189|nr:MULTISPECIES: hypothetical protein [unclassified Algibacter]MCL5127696.1 hypothetical protein [Algibacter sp. L4_22]
MSSIKNSRSKIIYWILLILSVIIGVIFYGILQGEFSMRFLVFFSGVPFFFFVTGVFGLMWPIIKPSGDEVYISHALMIGGFFIILFFIHVWLILPQICPHFGECLLGR